jgi:adenylosuccinate synthase
VREYSKLPVEAKKFVENIEQETGLKVILIGTGAELGDVVDRSSSSLSPNSV